MVDAVADDDEKVWPVSLVLQGEYGVEGVALSVPVTLGAGRLAIHEWELSAAEQDAFRRAAALVEEATERVAGALRVA